MKALNMNIGQLSAIMDMLMEPLGEYAPIKHIMLVDYSENGVDYNQDVLVMQPRTVSIDDVVRRVLSDMSKPGRVIHCIHEMDEETVTVHYISPALAATLR